MKLWEFLKRAFKVYRETVNAPASKEEEAKWQPYQF